MGRKSGGWKIRRKPERTGPFFVRFTHAAERFELATGTADQREAEGRAAVIYAEHVSGRATRSPVAASTTPVEDVLGEWIVAHENVVSEGTQALWQTYAKHFVQTFVTMGDFGAAQIEKYMHRRLGKALRATVIKELSAMRGFLRWATTHKYIAAAPSVPTVPGNVLGKRTGTRKAKHTAHASVDVEAVLRELPIWSSETHPARFPVQAYFRVLWETGLRPSTVQRLTAPEHYRVGAPELGITDDIDKARFGRPVPLTPAARSALDGVAPKQGPVFGEHDFRGFLNKAAKAAGLQDVADVISPYDMRHSRTTHLLEVSGDLPGTAYLVGHKQLTTTNIYGHANLRAAESVLASVEFCGESSGPKESSRPPEGERLLVLQGVRGPGLEPGRLLTASTSIMREAAILALCGGSSRQESAEIDTANRHSGEVPQNDGGQILPRLARCAAELVALTDPLDAYVLAFDDGTAEAINTGGSR